MLKGPVTIGYGLICHRFVHLVCLFYFFDTVLYETLLSSDLGFVLLLDFVLLSPLSLFLFEHEYVDFVASTPTFSLSLHPIICADFLTFLCSSLHFPLSPPSSPQYIPERAHQCSSLVTRLLRYSSFYIFNILLEVFGKPRAQ